MKFDGTRETGRTSSGESVEEEGEEGGGSEVGEGGEGFAGNGQPEMWMKEERGSVEGELGVSLGEMREVWWIRT